MAKRSLGSIILDVEARTQRLETQMKRANSVTRKYSLSMRKGFDGVSTAARRIAVALGLIAVPAALVALTKRSLDAGDALAKTSDKLGIATEKLAGLHHAAQLNGVSVETFNMALQRMVRRVAEAGQGTGEAVKALEELGLNAKELSALSPDKQFEMVADAMSQVATQGDRVRLAMKLFDSEGVSLVNVLRLGSDGLSKMQQEAEKLGLALNRVDAAKFEIANDAVLRLKEVFSGLGNQLAVQLSPLIAGVADALRDWGTAGEGMGAKVSAAFEKVAGYLGVVLDTLNKGRAVIKVLEGGLLNMVLTVARMAEMVGGIVQGLWDKLTAGANAVIEKFNSIPRMARLGIPDMPTFDAPKVFGLETVQDFTQGLQVEIDGLKEEIADLWGDKPSAKMEEFFAKAQAKYQELAETIAQARMDASLESIDFSVKGNTGEALWDQATFESVGGGLDRTQTKAEKLAETLKDGLEGAIRAGGDFKSVLSGIADSLLDNILKTQILSPLMGSLFGGAGTGGGGLFGGILGGIFGGARAAGGPVNTGMAYMVGEHGPELFVPSSSGRIVPNGSGAGATNVTINQNFALGVSDTVRAEMIGMMPAFRANAVAAVDEARIRRKTRRAG